MELILTDTNGKDLRILDYKTCDFDLKDNFDFAVVIDADDWSSDIKIGGRIYVPDSEIGGRIGGIETNTADNTITLKGYTWRGYLNKRIISPPNGSAYKTVKGEVNTIIRSEIDSLYDGVIKGSADITDCVISAYSYDRYTTVLAGITKMLRTKNYRPDIKYIQCEQDTAGYVEVSAVPIVDYSESIELSQDSKLNFIMDNVQNGINHLIALGSGELEQRKVIHFYLSQDGKIGKTQYYKGIDEITETYENANSEDLEDDAIKHFGEICSASSFSMDIEQLDIDIAIGDIIGGRDYITGISMKKSLAGKIITDNEELSIEYVLEE